MPLLRLLLRLRVLRCAASQPTGMESPLVWWSCRQPDVDYTAGNSMFTWWWSGKAGGRELRLESASVVSGLVESGQVLGHEWLGRLGQCRKFESGQLYIMFTTRQLML